MCTHSLELGASAPWSELSRKIWEENSPLSPARESSNSHHPFQRVPRAQGCRWGQAERQSIICCAAQARGMLQIRSKYSAGFTGGSLAMLGIKDSNPLACSCKGISLVPDGWVEELSMAPVPVICNRISRNF